MLQVWQHDHEERTKQKLTFVGTHGLHSQPQHTDSKQETEALTTQSERLSMSNN